MKAIRRAKLVDKDTKDKNAKGSLTSLARPGSPPQGQLGVSTSNVGNVINGTSGGALAGGSFPGDAQDTQVDWLPPKTLVKPAGQVLLSEKELDDDLTRILNANNPHAPQNIARYNNKERTYKASPYTEYMVVHFDFEGYLAYKGAPETSTFAAASTVTTTSSTGTGPDDPAGVATAATGEGTDTATADASTMSTMLTVTEAETVIQDDKLKNTKAVARNQFNFSERATQSVNNPYRHRSTNTEPPPHRTFSAAVNQWSIFDAYTEDTQTKEKAVKEKSKATSASAKAQKDDDSKLNQLPMVESQQHGEDIHRNGEFRKRLALVERMANQNTFDEITQDFKYWDDAADEFRESKEGTLLPLWHFMFEKEKKKHVTALNWNPSMSDFFAVGFGSYDFTRQGPGLICCFSLKNTSFPEYVFHTDSGVLCLDFHPQKTNLIAVGLHDGTTAVYDLHKKITENPVFKSMVKFGKHIDAVWQVLWQPDDLDGNSNFLSISSDGLVKQATLLKNELVCTEVLQLRTENGIDSGPILLGGTCFDFHKTNDHVFVVGTEEGKLMKCSKDYNSEYLQHYESHTMSVYKICYNKFYTDIFLTASGDWTVKLWDHNSSKPVLMFDLNCPVSDVAWAPYSSTVFAAVTADGKVVVFDLGINKFDPVCIQQVSKKAKLTHISFNPLEPIILVGDDKGNLITLKLSPNLRKVGRGGAAQKTTPEEQKERLERIVLLSLGKTPA